MKESNFLPKHPADALAKATHLDHAAFAKGFEWTELCDLAGFMTYRDLEAGDRLFDEGDPGTFMAVLLRGTLSVMKSGPGGSPSLVGDIHRGHTVGEQAIIDGQPRSATVCAQTHVKLLVLRQEAFETILQRHPRLGAKLLRSLAREVSARLRRTTAKLAREGGENSPE